MESFLQDVRYALRTLARTPAFAAVAVLTLALGIGANSAIFSVVNAVVLRDLPYPQPDRLMVLYHLSSDGNDGPMSPANFLDLRDQAQSFRSMAAYYGSGFTLTGQGEPERLQGAQASPGFFETLGVRPARGRTWTREENEPGKGDVVVLGHGLWQDRFGADPAVVGKRITLDGRAHTVIGVMPRGFSFPSNRVLWTPAEMSDDEWGPDSRGAWYLGVLGRLRPGVSPERARTEAATIAARLQKQYPDTNTGLGFTAEPLHEVLVGDVRTAMLVLLGAVGLVLLIACANVANLLLARSTARRGEIAVRIALGAGRGRLVRQLLTESVLLAAVGGALGLLLALQGTQLLLALEPQGIPRLDSVGVDAQVAGFTALVALVTGVLFGLVPALQSTSPHLAESLKEGGRGALAGRRGGRTRSLLVVAQTALAVVLLVGAGLLLHSFVKLRSVDPGFSTERAVVFGLSLPETAYDEARRVQLNDQLVSRLQALPGVRSAGTVLALPLRGFGFTFSFEVEGRPAPAPGEEPSMETRPATPGYFASMGIPLVRGRYFTEQDGPAAPQVVLLSQSAVRKYFPGEDPIGKVIRTGWGQGEGRPNAGGTVVGVVGDVKLFGLDEEEQPEMYVPYAQAPVGVVEVVVRTVVPPATLFDAVRREVHALDPNLPLSDLRTMEQHLASSVSQPRFYMLLLTIFGAVALVLAAVGIFGVMSYGVAQRTREIGIRMALGAGVGSVVRMVLSEGMVLVGIGVALGLGGALVLTRVLRGLLFGVSATDPATLLLVPVFLAGVALLAGWLPARRAARVDPMVALRQD